MVTIKGSTTITRPVEDVFDLVADERNEPTYNPQMTAVEKLNQGSSGYVVAFPAVARGRWEHRSVDAARWWAEVRRSWGFTPLSNEQEQCDLCGRTIQATAVELLAHRDWHQDKERHPSAQ